MKNRWAEKSGPVQSEKAVQVVLADYGGKDLWNRWVLSLEWNSECAMEGESGEQVGGELDSVTSSAAEWFMQGWRNETEKGVGWLLVVLVRLSVPVQVIDWRDVPVSEMTYNVLMGTLLY